MAGKGDSPRPLDQKKWDRNHKKIRFTGKDNAVRREKTSHKTTYYYG